MGASITIRPQARVDLAEIADFIAHDSLEAAERFLDATKAAFALLAEMPEMGTRCRFNNADASDIRLWSIRGFENHLVFYRPTSSGIEIVRVLHGSRDILALFADDAVY